MSETEEHVEFHENRDLGIRVEGRYKKVGNLMSVLTHWRIRHKAGAEFSQWYKVHGNQKKPIAGFKLVLDVVNDGDPRKVVVGG